MGFDFALVVDTLGPHYRALHYITPYPRPLAAQDSLSTRVSMFVTSLSPKLKT